MNGDNQSQQEQHQLAERVARVETALDYQPKAISELRDEMRAGFNRLHDNMQEGFNRADNRSDAQNSRLEAQNARLEAQAFRLEAQIYKARTTDFRILMSISMTTALTTIGLLVKAVGLI